MQAAGVQSQSNGAHVRHVIGKWVKVILAFLLFLLFKLCKLFELGCY